MSSKRFLIMLVFLLVCSQVEAAEETVKSGSKQVSQEETKELAGMSIVGNDEAPKSLYIVPWKSSELGIETSMNMMLNEQDVPIDRDVFMRQLEFYKVSTAQVDGQ